MTELHREIVCKLMDEVSEPSFEVWCIHSTGLEGRICGMVSGKEGKPNKP